MTHDRISHELALRQLPLVTVASYSKSGGWQAEGDSPNNLADAINHARLNGMAQLLVYSRDLLASSDKETTENMKRVDSNTRAIFDALTQPNEQFDLEPLKHLGYDLFVLTITRTLKKD